MLTKQDFDALDLRAQIEKVKDKWFYEDYKDHLKICKHHVVFNKDFRFDLFYHKPDYAKETSDWTAEKDIYWEGEFICSKGTHVHTEKGELISESFITVTENDDTWVDYLNGSEQHFYSEEDFAEDPSNILHDILLYIANCI